jgi:hypothetical protein
VAGQSLAERLAQHAPNVRASAVLRQIQGFCDREPVTWAALLELAGIQKCVDIPRGMFYVGQFLSEKAREQAEIRGSSTEHLGKLDSAIKMVWKKVLPPDSAVDATVRFQELHQEQFSATFRMMRCFVDHERAFGMVIDANGDLLLAEFGKTGGLNQRGDGPNRVEIPIGPVQESQGANRTNPTWMSGFFQAIRANAKLQVYPGIANTAIGTVATLAEFRSSIGGIYRVHTWNNAAIDATIRNRMLHVDRTITGRRKLKAQESRPNPDVEDEQLLTLVWRMTGTDGAKGLDSCLRFVHTQCTLLGYTSGTPIANEEMFVDPKLADLDYNLVRSDIDWDPKRTSRSKVKIKSAFYFSSVRLLERFTQQECNRVALVNCICRTLCSLAENHKLLFERVYIYARQRHVQGLLKRLVDRDLANYCARQRSMSLPESAEFPIRCVHLAPHWTINATCEDEFPELKKLRDLYESLGFKSAKRPKISEVVEGKPLVSPHS